MGEERPYTERRYRGVIEPEGLTCVRVVQGQSDLLVCTLGELAGAAAASLARQREDLEGYIAVRPDFATSFRPVSVAPDAPPIVQEMARAATEFEVGPMAAVAGAVAQRVGEDLRGLSSEVIVENGGDIFIAGTATRRVRVFAGASKLQLDLMVEGHPEGIGICSSSATVGPSISLGTADAVTVLAATATLADAAATALGNMVRSPEHIRGALEAASGHAGVRGAVVVAGGSVGAWGELEIT